MKLKGLGEKLDELNRQAVENSAEIEVPPGVETIGIMVEWGDQGVDRYFIYPDTLWLGHAPYMVFKTNSAADPSSTYIWRKVEPRWLQDRKATLWGYRVKGDDYQEVTAERAAELFPDAFPETPDVSKKWGYDPEA